MHSLAACSAVFLKQEISWKSGKSPDLILSHAFMILWLLSGSSALSFRSWQIDPAVSATFSWLPQRLPRPREERGIQILLSFRNLSVARASVFLAPKLQFGVTAMARNPRSEMTRECKSCHVDSEMELKSEPPWWWSCAQNNNLFHWTDSHNTYTPLIMTTLPT